MRAPVPVLVKKAQVPPSLFSQLPKLVGQAAAIAGVTLGAEALAQMARRSWQAVSFSRRYRDMIEANPNLREEDSQKVMDRFRVLDRFGPTISADPIVSGHFIRQTLEFPVLSPTVLKEVVEVENRARELNASPISRMMAPAISGHISKGLMNQGHDRGHDRD